MGFKERIKEARLAVGLTQEQVAKKVGVAKSTFTGYERGNSEPTVATTVKIIKALDIDANFLYQDYYPADAEISHEDKTLIKTFNSLDPHEQGLVKTILESECSRAKDNKKYEYSNVITIQPLVAEESIEYGVDAVHERTDIEITDDMKQHDDDIMDSDDF